MKKSQQTYLLDTAHKWAVRTLMGLTVVGCITFGLQMYNYINYVRPVRAELWRKNKENEVALEQQEKELELLRRQKAAEGLMES